MADENPHSRFSVAPSHALEGGFYGKTQQKGEKRMGMGVKVRVWGDYALFSRPEMKVERCSYDVITPSAARGILEAIYWHPGL